MPHQPTTLRNELGIYAFPTPLEIISVLQENLQTAMEQIGYEKANLPDIARQLAAMELLCRKYGEASADREAKMTMKTQDGTAARYRPDMRKAIETATGMDLPQLDGVRHVIIEGTVSTGKTTMAMQVASAIESEATIDLLAQEGEMSELATRCRNTTVVPINTAPPAKMVQDAAAKGPDVLIVGDICNDNAIEVYKLMKTKPAFLEEKIELPSIIACRYRSGAFIPFPKSTDRRGESDNERDATAVIRMKRNPTSGEREVDSVEAEFTTTEFHQIPPSDGELTVRQMTELRKDPLSCPNVTITAIWHAIEKGYLPADFMHQAGIAHQKAHDDSTDTNDE